MKYYFSEKVLLPVSDFITGNSIRKSLSFLLKSQYWSREQIDSFQNERLLRLIEHSYKTVPYYRELFDSINLKPSDIKSKFDLYKIPILKKATIQNRGIIRFTSSEYSDNKSSVVKMGSSGSTGHPLHYITTKDAYSMNIAANLRGWYWMGYRLGDKYIQLSQNSRNTFIKKTQDFFNQNLFLPTNPLTDENFSNILKRIEAYKPFYIRSYPDPILYLARYKKDHPEFTYKPLSITTTGNILRREAREEIEEVFDCRVFDSYSCEGNSNVFECPSHTCYHSSEEYGITEILDDDGNPVQSGIGRLISTDLWNFAHPFIRYETNDLVEVSNENCSCGRSHLKILKILGRDNDIVTNNEGRKFIVHNFTGFFQVDSPLINRSVKQFQIVKKKNGTYVFKLVVNEIFSETSSRYIIEYWKNELKSEVIIELCDVIPIYKNNKHKFIINE